MMAYRSLHVPVLLLLSAACSLASPSASSVPSGFDSGTEFAAHATGLSATSTPSATVRPIATAVDRVKIENARVNYYTINGSSASELRAQLDAKGPLGYDGYRGDATTNWYIRWNWPGFGSSTCDLSKATVSNEIVVDFPRWTPPDDASPELVDKWNRFVLGLAGHEQNHVDFVVENYLSVLDAIRSATCKTADAVAASALEPIRQLDREYDAVTNHGETEGVRFR